MRAFIATSWRYALLAAGLCVVMGLSLYAGAVTGNWLNATPQVGAAFGGMACCVALVYRARMPVTRADIYEALQQNRSPFPSLPGLVFVVFCAMCASGAVAGVVTDQFIDASQTINATFYGALLGLGLTLHHALTMPQHRDADHGDIHDNMRPATLAEALANGALSEDWQQGFFVGEWKEPFKTRFGRTRYKSYLLSTCSEMSGLLIAPPRSGKFICGVGSTALASAKNHVIFHDPKGEVVGVAAAGLRARGYRVAILDHVNTLGGKYGASASINPLGDLDPDSPEVEEHVAALTDIIIPKSDGDRNPFFPLTAQQLFAACCLHLLETEGANATLPMAASLINQSVESLNNTTLLMKNSRFESVRHVGNQWHLPVRDKSPLEKLAEAKQPPSPTPDKSPLEKRNEGLDGVLQTARSETRFLSTAPMRRMFGASTFSFKNMKRTDQKFALFNVCPEANAKATEKANQLIYSSAKNSITCLPKVPVLMVIDELCTAMDSSAAPLIQTMFNIGAGYGLKVVGVAQSWPQFVAWCGSDERAAAIRAAAGAVIYYGANDLMTAKHIREEVGNYTIWEPSTNPGAEAGVEGSTRPIALPLLRDSDLRAMLKDGRQVIMLAGVRMPVIMPRTPYFKIPVLNARAEENPFHTKIGG